MPATPRTLAVKMEARPDRTGLARPTVHHPRPPRRLLARRSPPWLAAAALVCLLVALSMAGTGTVDPAHAATKEYRYGDCRIEASVGPDGSVYFREYREHVFQGSFHWAKVAIPLSGRYSIDPDNFRVGEGRSEYVRSSSESPGHYSVTRTTEGIECKWFYEAENEARTFWLDYTVRRCVIAHADVAELYWKFVGAWDEPIDVLTAVVNLPPGARKQDVRAWGHGPLQGEVSIEEAPAPGGAAGGGVRVVFRCAGVPARTMVEGRVAFPKTLVPSCEARSNQTALPAILAEEQGWAEQANRKRSLMRLTARLDRSLWWAAILVPLALWFFLVYLRYDREFRPSYSGEYERDLPGDYSPAEMGVLWRFGNPGVQDLTATLLDLARRGYIVMKEEKEEKKRALGLLGTATVTTYRIEKGAAAEERGSLKPHERDLMDLLFYSVAKGGSSVTLSEIEAYAKKHPDRFSSEYASWQGLVRSQAREHGFFDQTVATGKALGAVLALCFVALGILVAARYRMVIVGPLMVVAGVYILAKSLAMKRRSKEGQEQFARWKAFRKFLLHFSSLDRAEIPALTLWEKYLVYAVSLGVAKQVLDQLRLVFPDVARGEAPFGAGWAAAGLHSDSFAAFSHLSGALSSSLAAASKASSGSGGGGGFSGGGGGGGGGSSGSAG